MSEQPVLGPVFQSEADTTPMEQASDLPHFDIDASIVFQLGESLITDEMQALLELIKNSYDAGADAVDVAIETRSPPENSDYPNARGYISINDNGIGMNHNDLVRGWLTISGSPKRAVKRGTTPLKALPRGRFPLGDKGLGRLGVQRLGNNLEIETRPGAGRPNMDSQYRLSFSWDDFRKVERLSQVKVPIAESIGTRKQGTSIIVSDLRDVKIWEDSKIVGSLQGRLAQLFSPFVPVPEFAVTLQLNGTSLDLLSADADVLNAALVEYTLSYAKGTLSLVGKARLAFLRPDKDDEQDQFLKLIEADDGSAFLQFLDDQKDAPKYRVRRSKASGWFVEFETTVDLEQLDGVEMVKQGDQQSDNGKARLKPADPGPFDGKVYYFDFRKADARPSRYPKAKDFSTYVRQFTGIRVYRDGFGVRVDRDWLKMSEAFTSGSSYYYLRPANTVGYVAISSRENAVLEETTDREGFVDSPYYRNFYALLSQFVAFSNDAQEFLRRGWIDFRKEHTKTVAGSAATASPQMRAGNVVAGLSAARTAAVRMRALNSRITAELADSERVLSESSAVIERPDADPSAVDQVLATIATRVDSLRTLLSDVRLQFDEAERFFESMRQLEAQAELVRDDLLSVQNRLADLHDMVSLGLTAEALSHEIANVLAQLADRARAFSQHIRRSRITDTQTISFASFVGTSVNALRKQLTHLAPSLRYVREQRTAFEIGSAIDELVAYYSGRMERYEGRVTVCLTKLADFRINMNRGKFTQVVDNLVLNSEYWLAEELRVGRLETGVITIEVDQPFLRVYDNGRGIDPVLERSLFEPFVTGKAPGMGRGLGLFIVEQLLESEGCRIALLPDRNRYGRLYIFEIDLTGALYLDNA